ncbi:MAG TPA: DNA-3-methyladenine glycosylase [Bacteroidota bacterium]|nr:DNA-3-methyladenine glycosylase [Bacteroidota bacterium]
MPRLRPVFVEKRRLPRRFFSRETLPVARDLLGTYLVRVTGRGRLVGKIVEVEAYPGTGDPASHSYNGETPRNAVMFGGGGRLYVYFTYGMHFCANIVTGKKGEGCAVLIRAVEPVEGLARMVRNRDLDGEPADPRSLSGGPARVCQALGITMRQNGTDLTGPELYIVTGEPVPDSGVVATTRIGISSAKNKKWRFYLRDSPYVSKK